MSIVNELDTLSQETNQTTYMGPVALFDKSVLQSLSIDESVWFDQFYLPLICPMFYVETLADLGKSTSDSTSIRQVRRIADKFPECNGSLSAHHQDLSISDLLGGNIPMIRKVILPNGRGVAWENKTGTIYDLPAEVEAFNRWQKGDFGEIEHQIARKWRENLNSINLSEYSTRFRTLDSNVSNCRSLDEVYVNAKSIVTDQDKQFELMTLALDFFNVPLPLRRSIMETWNTYNNLPLTDYAPYAFYVLTVDLFFQIALKSSLISVERNSNLVDIAYLFYLPFCNVFTSSDRLHKRCAKLFLREDQDFVWGQDLKTDLAEINVSFSKLPNDEKERGLTHFAKYPPSDGGSLTSRLWNRHIPQKRERASEQTIKSGDDAGLLQEIESFKNAQQLPDKAIRPTDTNMMIERKVKLKKGQWYQLPKDFRD